MAYGLYPDPATRALSVPAGATQFTDVAAQYGHVAEFDPPYPQVMLLRVAALDGAAPPRLLLAAGTGPAVEVSPNTQAVYGAGPDTGYVGDVWLTPVSATVTDVVVGLPAPADVRWRLGIRNTDTATRQYTFLVTGDPAERDNPWVAGAPSYRVAPPITTGQRPHGVAVDALTRMAFTADSVGNTVTLIDLTGRTAIGTVAVGRQPEHICAHPDTHTVYVTSRPDATISIIDPSRPAVLTTVTGVPEPGGLSIDAARRTVYAGAYRSGGQGTPAGTVVKIDTGTHTVTRRQQVPYAPVDLSVATTTHTVYLAEAAHGSVSALDPQSGALTTLRTGIRAAAIATDPAGTRLYVTHPDDTVLTVIDTATANAVAVPVGAAPGRPAVDPDAYTVYVPARRAGMVIAIDTRTLSTTTIPVGPLPYAVAIDTATRAVLCTNAGDDTVSIIERQP